jgi:hypothetical protein
VYRRHESTRRCILPSRGAAHKPLDRGARELGQTEFSVSSELRKDQPVRLGADLSNGVSIFDVRLEGAAGVAGCADQPRHRDGRRVPDGWWAYGIRGHGLPRHLGCGVRTLGSTGGAKPRHGRPLHRHLLRRPPTPIRAGGSAPHAHCVRGAPTTAARRQSTKIEYVYTVPPTAAIMVVPSADTAKSNMPDHASATPHTAPVSPS